MAITYHAGRRIQGLSTDTKPTNVQSGSRFEETDTRKIYYLDSNYVVSSVGLGSSADGTNNGATTSATGKVGSYAWSFDGSNDYVDLGTPILGASGSTTASFSFWSNLSSTGFVYTDGNYISTSTWATTIEQLTNGNTRLFIASSGADGGGNYVTSTATVSAGWNHWVLTYDGSGSTNADKIKIYLNGSEVSGYLYNGTIPSSIKTVTPNARIGALYTVAGNYFGGLIDELAIFTRVLTSTEISQLYNSGTGKSIQQAITDHSFSVTGLKAYYDFEQTSGDLINKAVTSAVWTEEV